MDKHEREAIYITAALAKETYVMELATEYLDSSLIKLEYGYPVSGDLLTRLYRP